jgi:hypothetical protein
LKVPSQAVGFGRAIKSRQRQVFGDLEWGASLSAQGSMVL